MSNDEEIEGKCNYHPTQDGGYCGQRAGMGTDHLGEGYCKFHGGCSTGGPREGAGAPDENVNAVTHSLHAKTNPVYQKVFSDEIRTVVDDIYEDYVKDYTERHGEPPYGHEAELFRIAVSYGKHLHSEDWAIDRPRDSDSGNAMVDSEKMVSETGQVYYKYKQTVVQKGQKSLSQDRRMWLKDLGLLDTSPESQKAGAIGDLASIITEGES